MLKVVVVEDNDSIREGLKILIDGTEGYSCIESFSDCESMLKKIVKLKPDVLLMDLGLPGMSGVEGIKKAKAFLPELTILVLTVYEENELVFDALCAGASGYLVKKTPPSKLLEAIKEAHEGGAPMSSHIARKVIDFFQTKKPVSLQKSVYTLTPREKEILTGLVEGHNFKFIADSLYISIETVRFHFRNIYKKLHVHSQSEAVAKAIREGII
ncbi:response regulator transcription factor [bacterium BMS3Abin03]|jgi:DNA-binding NarL/FixJ family response regulator|nr:response regulator transcription factor [bacterium BMS3Abin03]MCG6961232.1 response regulator transcription factor [bacterium BMS3Abin03]